MSPALVLEDLLPRPSFTSGGLWTPSKASLTRPNNSSHRSWSSPSPSSSSQPQPLSSQTQQQKEPIRLQDDDLADDINALWSTRWKHACRRRQHPFQDASYLDFAPVFAALTAQGVTSARSPAYTRTLAAAARALAESADAHAPVEPELASRLLLRACALLRVARYPSHEGSSSSSSAPSEDEDDLKREARELQRTYHRRAVGLLPSARDSPAEEVLVPHLRDTAATGGGSGSGSGSTRNFDMGVREPGAGRTNHQPQPRRRAHIPLLVRVPGHTLRTGAPCPAAVVLARDRTGATRACEAALARGWAAVVVECPGSPEEAARTCASVLDWMAAVGFYDTERVVALGEGDAVLCAAAAPACGPRLRGVVAYVDGAGTGGEREREQEVEEQEEQEMMVGKEAPRCHVLVVSGASKTVESNGLWTPAAERMMEQEGEEEDGEVRLVALAAYGPGSRERVGSLETAGGARAHDWLEDVMEGREPRVPGRVVIPAAHARGEAGEEKSSSALRSMPDWFSRESTPPGSDVDMASACGSSP